MFNKLSITHVSAYYPPSLGGLERVAEQLAIQQALSGHEVKVVSSDIGYEKSFKDPAIQGYEVKRLRSVVIANVPIIFNLFLELIKSPKGSIFHIHVAQAFVPEISLIAGRIRRAKVVAHFHLDVMPSGRLGFLFGAYKKTLFGWMLRRVDEVIVFSEDQKLLVSHKYGVQALRIKIIPNGVSRDFFDMGKKEMHVKPRILFVGRLSYQKNLSMLLASLDGISDNFDTTLVGSGELENELMAMADRLCLKNIHFVGRMDGADLLREYQKADFFLLPSEREGMPLVLMEAMAMRLPIIGTDVLGTRDLVQDGHNGILVKLGDVQAMRNAIQSMASNKARYQTMSDNAYKLVKGFSWESISNRIVRVVYGVNNEN